MPEHCRHENFSASVTSSFWNDTDSLARHTSTGTANVHGYALKTIHVCLTPHG